MQEHLTQSNSAPEKPTLETIYAQIASMEPKPIAAFVPADAAEQKAKFLAGDIRNPDHTYDKLASLTPSEDAQKIRMLGAQLTEVTSPNSVQYLAYVQYAHRYARIQDLLQAVADAKVGDDETRMNAQSEFMKCNIELYGEPDKATFESLIAETKTALNEKQLIPEAAQIRAELNSLLPETSATNERFKPSQDTVKNMQHVAEILYGDMLSHIPDDKEKFSPVEVATIFAEIIEQEFGGAADDWKVEVTKATSINVVASEKTIKIPEDRKDLSRQDLRGLVAHEIGVHMLRAVMGSQTDLPILTTGLSEYYDAEEGLGKVMEQAVKGEYKDSGIPYYQAAGLMYFEQNDFRDTHEIMWRIKLLSSLKPSEVPTNEHIEKARDDAYKTVLRIARGTDELPWFNDLAYYNGSSRIWKLCESFHDDPLMLTLLFTGKADPSNDEHLRILLETRSV